MNTTRDKDDPRDVALTHISNAVLVVGPDGRISFFNNRLLSIFGLSSHLISVGMELSTFIANIAPSLGWDAARSDRVFANHLLWMMAKDVTRLEHHLADGRTLYVTCHPLEGGGAVLVYDDVTQAYRSTEERLVFEKDARRSERNFKLLVEGITDYAIYLLDPVGRIVNWNAGAQRAKGYTTQEIVGQSFARFYSVEDQEASLPQQNLETALREGRFEAEGSRYRKNGSTFWAHVVIDPIYEDDGSLLGYAKITRDMTEQKRNAERITYLARHDALTGLPNRTRVLEMLETAMEAACAAGIQLAVINIDLDGFKSVNDTHGHATGDLLLQRLAARMNECLQPGEQAGRFGGDEFVAFKVFSNRSMLTDFIMRLRSALTDPVCVVQSEFKPAASLGISVYPTDAQDRDKLIDNADLAMYRAKSHPSDKICFFTPAMDEAERSRRTIAADIWKGLERGEFQLQYQTQRDICTTSIISYEALLRWEHPIRGLIPPSVFIPIAEECGAIIPLGAWVLEKACTEAVAFSLPRVSVNVSPVQLGSDAIFDTIKAILEKTGLSPHHLELEVTESVFISDRNRAFRILSSIKRLGIKIAIDDFGTGYSSLETLRSFPFDRLKLDRSFTKGLENDGKARAFVSAMITLGRSLDLSVLAEGVETEQQRDFLAGAGCMEIQGFLFDRPACLGKHPDVTGIASASHVP